MERLNKNNEMILKLDRKYLKERYTIGALFVDGRYFCDTIEDRDRGLDASMPLNKIRRAKVDGETAIPRGNYLIDMDTVSTRFKGRAWAIPYGGKPPRIIAVPCFSGVLVHPGNDEGNTSGCVIVGENRVRGKVVNSVSCFRRLMDEFLVPAHERGEEIRIEIC